MKRADYVCPKCDREKEEWTAGEFPEHIICDACRALMHRDYSKTNIAVRVVQGRTGNSKTGYASNKSYLKQT
jgi:hypothetical protein